MYTATLLFGLIGGGWLAVSGFSRGRHARTWLGVAVVLGTGTLFGVMSFWGELLWFESLGFERRFWTMIFTRVGIITLGGFVAYAVASLVAGLAEKIVRVTVARIAAVAGIVWGAASWETALLFLNGRATGATEPMLGIDIGFYLFVLPFLDGLFWLLLSIAVTSLGGILLLGKTLSQPGLRLVVSTGEPDHRLAIPVASAFLALVLAFGELLMVFHLLYSQLGVVMGPGWTDVHVRYPALLIMGGVVLVAGLLPLSGRFRTWMTHQVRRWLPLGPPHLTATLAAWAAISLAWTVIVVVVPVLVQWLVVKPNEITFEVPYIARNIEFTRQAFKLDSVEERQFEPREDFPPNLVTDYRHLLDEVRLWDWRALDAVYKQFQEIRLYYEFADIDLDRYTIGDRYRQVMISARELVKSNLPPQSQTFVNERFKYTHGYGYTLAPVSDFTGEGLPNLLVQDIPPRAKAPELAVDRPEIYYGELTRDAAVVNTSEPEFDYPSGETNVYARYAGTGGVALSSFWRRLLFGWKFDGTLLLLSSYPTRESRIMFHRRVQDRVARIAPFLEFDEDPYITAVDGHLYWIFDAYTRSSYYPYSQPFESGEWIDFQREHIDRIGQRTVTQLNGKNYVRNAVKAVVNAYDGSVELYVFDAEDPIVSAWRRTFPDLFHDASDMPDGLRAHVRYPQDLLLVQGLIYAKYHMTDPEVFYNQEDLWVRATEKHYDDIAAVEPYYIMWELPGSKRAEFALILPFTPKNKQVLIGWIAALCDGDNYGRILAYKFSKDRRVLGPQQIETKIDQDSFLSGQLTLWGQQGSQVIRGNVLAIPLDDTLLYVEPIYLRADTAAYPELRLIAVMHGDRLSYAETFDGALQGLMMDRAPVQEAIGDNLARKAKRAFDAYLNSLGASEFEEAARQLEQLQQLLEQMNL